MTLTITHPFVSPIPDIASTSIVKPSNWNDVHSLSGVLDLAYGGTGAALTGSTGGIVYSGSSALAILGATATANQMLMSGASAAPSWSTSAWPSDVSGAGQLLISSGAHTWTATASPVFTGTLTFADGTAWGSNGVVGIFDVTVSSGAPIASFNNHAASQNAIVSIVTNQTTTSLNLAFSNTAIPTYSYIQGQNYLAFYTGGTSTFGSASQAMLINASGGVQIGGTNADPGSNNLQVAGTVNAIGSYYMNSVQILKFVSDYVEISAGGLSNILIGNSDEDIYFRGSVQIQSLTDTPWYLINGTEVQPQTDNSSALGDATHRFSSIWAVDVITYDASAFIKTGTALTNGAGSSAGTITNAPSIGNPTKWVPINDDGTTRYIPAW